MTGFVDVASAMGWSGTYEHCACCNPGCKMRHYAPCIGQHYTPAELADLWDADMADDLYDARDEDL